jgi:RimJ/RimL family protein N-acetyltransferase
MQSAPSSSYRIVPAAEEHIPGFWKVLDAVARESRYLAMLEAPPIEETRKFVLGNIRTGSPQFVAIVEDAVVGWCDVLLKERPILRHGGVLGMGIAAPFRGRGIGPALVEATLKAAREKGLTRIELLVRVDNERAKRLYEKFGFAVEGLCRNHLFVEGRYEDSYLMALLY